MAKKPAPTAADRIYAVYDKLLDSVEREFDLGDVGINQKRFSTGLLSVDLVLGGGMVPGMTTFSGPETSGKSTLGMHVIGNGLASRIPILQYRDAEGSADGTYTAGILGVRSLNQVFGEKDKDGNWLLRPRCRYYTDNVIENLFDSLVKTLNRIPDKIYRAERKEWFMVLDKKDKRTTIFSEVFGKPDHKLSQKTGRLWFPTEDAGPQAVILCDSWPSFVPGNVDEKEDASGGLSLDAREYSKHLKRIVGKLRKKQAIIGGINQLREKPMVMYGSPWYEPSGNALKFYSNCRNQIFPRAVPAEWRSDSKNSAITNEPSVEGEGFDSYAYKELKNTKNKNGTPYLKCSMRVWTRDVHGNGRGFDLVYDAFEFLRLVGVVSRGKRNAVIFAKDKTVPWGGKSFTWVEFKTLILAKQSGASRELKAAADKLQKKHKLPPTDIRSWSRKMLETGEAKERMVKLLNSAKEDDTDLEG